MGSLKVSRETKMGATTSKNVATAVTKAIAKVSSDIIQQTALSMDQSQVISVHDVNGDVDISGNVFKQKATINMRALLDALAKDENQQKIMLELAQQAKSITSGLNLAQYASTQNTMNTLITAMASIMSTIAQSCSAFSKQFQQITVERVHGHVTISNNVQEQLTDMMIDCAQKAVADNRTIQDLTAKLDQAASSTAEGLSPWIIAAIVAAVIGIPVIGGALALPRLLKVIFPVILIAGIILLVLYYTRGKDEMKLTAFSSFIQGNASCVGGVPQTATTFATPEAASAQCMSDSNCKAFDWAAFSVDTLGGYTPRVPPLTRFFSSVSPSCTLKQDHMRVLTKPSKQMGVGAPVTTAASGSSQDPSAVVADGAIGDIFLNTSPTANGRWYQRTDNWPTGWQPMGQLTTNTFTRISWGSNSPAAVTDPQPNDVFVQFDDTPQTFTVFRYTNGQWVQERKIKGPGLTPATPPQTNTSGIKTVVRPEWMLWTGVGCIIVGIGGTIFTTIFPTKEQYTLQDCKDFPFSF